MNENELIKNTSKQFNEFKSQNDEVVEKNFFSSSFRAIFAFLWARNDNKSKNSSIFNNEGNDATTEIKNKTNIKSLKKQRKINPEEAEIVKQVDDLLKVGFLPMIVDLQNNGYELFENQKESFEKIILDKLVQGNYEMLESLLEKGYEPTNTLLCRWIIEGKNDSIIHFITENFNDKWYDKEFVKELLDYWKDEIISYDKELKTKHKEIIFPHKHDEIMFNMTLKTGVNRSKNIKVYEQYSEVLSNIVQSCFSQIEEEVAYKQYLEIFTIVRSQMTGIEEIKKYTTDAFSNAPILSSINKIIKTVKKMESQLEHDFSDDKERLLDKVKVMNIDDILEKNMLKESMHMSHRTKIAKLPQDAQELIKSINKKIKEATKDRETMLKESWMTIEGIYQRTLPEVLQNYLSLSKEYRDEFKNAKGENATQLMMQSLFNIEETLDKILFSTNHEKLTELSVTQRYTKDIKNSM